MFYPLIFSYLQNSGITGLETISVSQKLGGKGNMAKNVIIIIYSNTKHGAAQWCTKDEEFESFWLIWHCCPT